MCCSWLFEWCCAHRSFRAYRVSIPPALGVRQIRRTPPLCAPVDVAVAHERTTLLALLGSLYTCGILYHISYNTYADRITGRSRVIVTSERFEALVGRAVWDNTLTNHKILPRTSRRHKLVTRIGEA